MDKLLFTLPVRRMMLALQKCYWGTIQSVWGSKTRYSETCKYTCSVTSTHSTCVHRHL